MNETDRGSFRVRLSRWPKTSPGAGTPLQPRSPLRRRAPRSAFYCADLFFRVRCAPPAVRRQFFRRYPAFRSKACSHRFALVGLSAVRTDRRHLRRDDRINRLFEHQDPMAAADGTSPPDRLRRPARRDLHANCGTVLSNCHCFLPVRALPPRPGESARRSTVTSAVKRLASCIRRCLR